MYALRDYLGEDVLNGALRSYLENVRFQEAPYTTSDEFIAALRAVTPDELQYLITDLFETITLYDNRALDATWRVTADGRYAVTLKVRAAKFRSDDQGRETPAEMDDLVDIGVFSGHGKQEKALFLEKRRLTSGEVVFEILVDLPPSRAGIDPYNKLIDRASDDNVIAVSPGGGG